MDITEQQRSEAQKKALTKLFTGEESVCYWNDAKQPPKKLTQCIFKGGKYAVAEGIWWEGDGELKPAGFYVQAGDNFFPATWVEVWMPMPEKRKPLNDKLTQDARP